jgi:AraC-like DNA-binding protein
LSLLFDLLVPGEQVLRKFVVPHMTAGIFNIDFLTYSDSPFERAQSNRILLNTAGSAGVVIDDKQFAAKGNEIVLVGNKQLFGLEQVKGLNGFEISFDDFFWERSPASASNCKSVLFDNTAFNQVISVNEQQKEELVQVFRLLQNEYQKDDFFSKADVLAAFLKIIMIKIANITANQTDGFDSYDYRQYRQFYNLINVGKLPSHEVDHYAKLLGIHPRKLTAVCKSYSGKGAKELISDMIINEAKRELQFGALPVKEIAYQLQFSSPEQFSHFFKKHTGHAPIDFRNSYVKMHR